MSTSDNKNKIGKHLQADMEMTTQQVADTLGVTRQAVSLMEHKIYRKIRKALMMKGIKKEDILPDD